MTREIIKTLLPDLDKDDFERIIKFKGKLYFRFLHETRLNQAVARILDKYFKKKTVLATNSRNERAVMILEHHQLNGKFSLRFYKEDMVALINKFEHILSVLRVPANLIIVFENNKSEIHTAINAGIPEENIFRVIQNAT